MGPKVSIADLERAMGQKASKISDYTFDPETMSFGRTITFDLNTKNPKPRKLSKRGKK